METTFLATCIQIRTGNTGPLVDLPLDAFPDGFGSLRVQTEDAIACVPVYLSFVSSLSPGLRAWQLGRALVWNLTEEAHFQYTLPDAYPQLALKAFNQYLAANPGSPFQYVIQVACRVLLGRDTDLSEAEFATAAGLLETTMPVLSGVVTVDPRVPLADIPNSQDLANKYKDWIAPSALIDFESDAVQEVLAYALAALFDRDAPSHLATSLQHDIANESLFRKEGISTDQLVTTGYLSQVFGALLKYENVARRTPQLAGRTFTLLSARKNLMKASYVAHPSIAWSVPMSVSYQSNFYLGRCGTAAGPIAQNTTSVNQLDGGKQCNYDGTPGYAYFDVATIASQFTPGDLKSNVSSARYVIEVGAKMRGGHRNGGILGGAEDETASVDYSLSGSIQIPQCGDLRTCNPEVWITLQDLTSDPEPAAQRKTIVQYQAPPDNTWNTLTSSVVALSRSEGPINLQIAMSRSAGHVGACCEKDWAHHAIVISANAPIPEGLFDLGPYNALDDMYFYTLRGSPPPGLRQGPQPLVAQDLLQIGQNERQFPTRFANIYSRILETYVFLQAPEMSLSGIQLDGLREAQGLLTLEARAAHLEAARQAYRSTQKAVGDLDLPSFITTINKSIEDLISTPDNDLTSSVGFISAFDQKVSAAPGQSEVASLSGAVRTAVAHSDRSQTILALMQLRGKLRTVLLGWQRQLRDLATEVTQMDPSLAGDPSRF